MKYLLLILTLSLSSNCIAQKFSKLIKKAETLKGKEDCDAAFLVLGDAWKVAGSDRDKQVEVLFQTASNYRKLNKFSQLDSISTIAIAMCEGQQNPFYVRFICLSALAKAGLGDFEKALILADKATQLCELNSYDYIWNTGTKGIVLYKQGNSKEAVETFKTSYELIQNKNLIDDENLYYTQVTYVEALQDIGDFKLAKQITEKLLPEFIAKTGNHSIFTNACYNSLGIYYAEISDYDQSVYYFKKANPISTKKNNLEDYLIGLTNIAAIYPMAHMDVDSAIFYKNLLKETLKEVKDTALLQTFTLQMYNLENLIYGGIGDYDNGIRSGQQAVEYIEKRNLQKKYAHFVVILWSNMGTSYIGKKDYEKAIFCCEKSLDANSLAGIEPNDATLFANFSNGYDHLKQYDNALKFVEKGLVLSEKFYGKESSRHIYYLAGKGVTLIRLKKFKEGIPLIQNALKEARKNLGEYNERTIAYTSNLLSAYHILQQKDSIIIVSKNINNSLSGIYKKTLPNLSERNRNHFIKKYEDDTHKLFSGILENPTTPELTSIAYDHALLTKGIVQAYTQTWKQQLEKTTDKKLKILYDSWLENKLLISKQYEIEIAARVPNLDSIVTLTENMESQLSQKSASFRLANEQVNWQQVQSKLKDNEASVEFIHFQYHNGFEMTDSIMYAALVLKKGDIAPTLVPLFEEKALNTLLEASRIYRQDDKSDLYRLIWQPLEKYLGNIQNIYYAPSGKLELVSFDALCYKRERFLNDKYSVFRRLRSTRALFFGLDDTPLRVTKNTRNLLLGDVKYGINDNPKDGDVATMEGRNKPFKRLQNAARQYNTIDSLTRFYKLKNLNQRQYEANEAYFKRIVAENNESPEVIQFFTHGFYQEKPTFSERCALLAIKDPLYRSGVALANSNVAWCEGKNTKDKEDGLLTAAEISTMDLSNTKVVILTACQSGLGDLQGSEGIQGLQSAFKMANAKTQLVALWNLESIYAEHFSSLFYDKILRGASPYEAFRATQAEVIQSGKYGVNVWGAFVLVE
jgi:CHAT domain-containing protein